MTDSMNYTKGDWKAGYNPNVTGPTTPGIQLFCGGRDWPYKTVNVGEETIAIVPAQIYKRTKIGKLSEHLIDTENNLVYLNLQFKDELLRLTQL